MEWILYLAFFVSRWWKQLLFESFGLTENRDFFRLVRGAFGKSEYLIITTLFAIHKSSESTVFPFVRTILCYLTFLENLDEIPVVYDSVCVFLMWKAGVA